MCVRCRKCENGAQTGGLNILNSNLEIHKQGYDIETTAGTEYQDCFEYTATKECFVLLNAASLYSNYMPAGIKIITNANVKNNAVNPYWWTVSEGSGSWLNTMTSGLVRLTPGTSVKVQQKISTDTGVISGAVSYIVVS